MKIKINHTLFKKVLKTLHRVSYVSKNSPKFNSFFLETKNDYMVASAKNELITVERIISASDDLKILRTGKMIVNAFVLNEIVQRTDQAINLEVVEKNFAILHTEKYETKINLLDLEQFWSGFQFDVDGVQTMTLVDHWQKVISHVGYAALTREGKEIFRGINLRTKHENLIATATDGMRIARSVLFPSEDDFDLVMYPQTISEVIRIADLEKMQEIHATFGETAVLFQIGKGIKLFSRILAGPKKFPDTEKQFLHPFETFVECTKSELIDAVDKAGIIFKKDDIPSVVFLVEKKEFRVNSLENSEIGSFEQKITTTKITGENKKIVLQTRFVLSALKSLPESDIVVSFSVDDGPVLFTNKGCDNLKTLILPVWV